MDNLYGIKNNMKINKSTQQELIEPSLIAQMQPIMKDGYCDKSLQPELSNALPLLIYNIVNNYSEQDLITDDLIATNHLSEYLATVTDTYEADTVIATIIQAFSDLKTNGKEFHTGIAPRINININNQNKVITLETIGLTFTFKNDLETDMELFCVFLTKQLQDFIDKWKYIIFYNVSVIKTYDTDMNPQIMLMFIMSGEEPDTRQHVNIEEEYEINGNLHEEEPEIDAEFPDSSNYANEHVESADDDFMERFALHAKLIDNGPMSHDMSEAGHIELGSKPLNFNPMSEWIPHPGDPEDFTTEIIEEDDDLAPNTGLKDASSRYRPGNKEFIGAYEFGKPGYKMCSIPYHTKPSMWNRFWTRILLGITWIDYKKDNLNGCI